MLLEEGLNERVRKEVALELPSSSLQDDIMRGVVSNSWVAEEGAADAASQIGSLAGCRAGWESRRKTGCRGVQPWFYCLILSTSARLKDRSSPMQLALLLGIKKKGSTIVSG